MELRWTVNAPQRMIPQLTDNGKDNARGRMTVTRFIKKLKQQTKMIARNEPKVQGTVVSFVNYRVLFFLLPPLVI